MQSSWISEDVSFQKFNACSNRENFIKGGLPFVISVAELLKIINPIWIFLFIYDFLNLPIIPSSFISELATALPSLTTWINLDSGKIFDRNSMWLSAPVGDGQKSQAIPDGYALVRPFLYFDLSLIWPLGGTYQ